MRKNLLDFQGAWEKLVEKRFEKGLISLTNEEKIWYTSEVLIIDIQNGGLISHFYNGGADNLWETLKSLEQLNCNSLIEKINLIKDYFPDRTVSTDIYERNEVISTWSDDIGNAIEKIEKENPTTQALAIDLENKIYDYIKSNEIYLKV